MIINKIKSILIKEKKSTIIENAITKALNFLQR